MGKACGPGPMLPFPGDIVYTACHISLWWRKNNITPFVFICSGAAPFAELVSLLFAVHVPVFFTCYCTVQYLFYHHRVWNSSQRWFMLISAILKLSIIECVVLVLVENWGDTHKHTNAPSFFDPYLQPGSAWTTGPSGACLLPVLFRRKQGNVIPGTNYCGIPAALCFLLCLITMHINDYCIWTHDSHIQYRGETK